MNHSAPSEPSAIPCGPGVLPGMTNSLRWEGAADAAAQHADCLKVGIDDSVTPNVQYDDQTGACSLDTGSDNGGN